VAAKDFYQVLGVPDSATQDEVKKAYRRLAKRYHPDANQNDPKSADRFKEISEAYQVIGDAEKRKQYDDMRRLYSRGDEAYIRLTGVVWNVAAVELWFTRQGFASTRKRQA